MTCFQTAPLLRTLLRTLCLAMVLATPGLTSQDPAVPAVPTVPTGSRPAIQLETQDGKVTELPLEQLPIRDPRTLGAIFLRSVNFPEPAPPSGLRADRVWVQLHSGDRIEGHITGGDEESLILLLHGGVQVVLSIEEVAAILCPARQPGSGSVLPVPAEQGDRLYVRRGTGLDRLDGLLDAFTEEGVRFQGRFGQRVHPWQEVAALFIEQLNAPPSSVVEVPVVLDLVGGGRLSGALVSVLPTGVELTTTAGSVLLVPLPLLRELVVDDGSVRFLSELPLADEGPTDLFGGRDGLGMRYPPQMDRNFAGLALRTGSRTWSRGIGVHAPSRLTWQLDGGWGGLRVLVGMDDSTLEDEFRGSAVFRILVDGKERWASPLMRGGDGALEVPTLDLLGAQTLVLEVDPAGEAFFCDRANWLRPILVKRPPASR